MAIDELLAEEADPDLERELVDSLGELEADVDRLELAALLSGPYDASDAIATINAGAGMLSVKGRRGSISRCHRSSPIPRSRNSSS